MDFRNDAQYKRAVMEDALVDLVYKEFGAFVMHGGTAVWRCYGGNRFSRDVDFYANLDPHSESVLQKKMHKTLVDDSYQITEEKYNNSTLTLHMIVRGYDTTGKLDITFAHAKGEAAEYARVDGSKRIIYALSPELILNEKIATYADKFKRGTAEIQDIYDMLVLKDRILDPEEKTLSALSKLLDVIEKKPPGNEKGLVNLLLGGAAPGFDYIVKTLRAWLNDNAK